MFQNAPHLVLKNISFVEIEVKRINMKNDSSTTGPSFIINPYTNKNPANMLIGRAIFQKTKASDRSSVEFFDDTLHFNSFKISEDNIQYHITNNPLDFIMFYLPSIHPSNHLYRISYQYLGYDVDTKIFTFRRNNADHTYNNDGEIRKIKAGVSIISSH